MNDNFFKESEDFLDELQKGRAFLVTKKGEKINIMVIGWGFIGYIWNKPYMIIAVRVSRHTYDMLQGTDEFVVSIPEKNEYRDALEICGSQSGRDIDKIEECGFEMIGGTKVSVPYIKGSKYNYECRVDYRQMLDPEALEISIKKSCYPEDDFHLMLYGEILSRH